MHTQCRDAASNRSRLQRPASVRSNIATHEHANSPLARAGKHVLCIFTLPPVHMNHCDRHHSPQRLSYGTCGSLESTGACGLGFHNSNMHVLRNKSCEGIFPPPNCTLHRGGLLALHIKSVHDCGRIILWLAMVQQIQSRFLQVLPLYTQPSP